MCLPLPVLIGVLLVLNLSTLCTRSVRHPPFVMQPCVCLQQNAGSEHKGKFSRLTYFYSPSGKANSFPVSTQLRGVYPTPICVWLDVMQYRL